MLRIKATENDNMYMYKYHTHSCTKKKCRNPSKCFDTHSLDMRRRVPSLREDGLFNYIPELCPQWGKSKKCNKGDRCYHSHGWLEIIFHPLLFKTKMCQSTRKNGVCRKYGFYCAKAHNPSEIRNLVQIYGKNWKRHYDLSLRDEDAATLGLTNRYRSSKINSVRFSKMLYNENFVSDSTMDRRKVGATQSEQNKDEGYTETSPYYYSSRDANKSANSPFCSYTSSQLCGEYTSICDVKTDRILDQEIKSYIQLYSEEMAMSESTNSDSSASCKFIDPEVRCDDTWNWTEDAIPLKDSTLSSSINSNFISPFLDTWKLNQTLDVYWKKKVEHSEWCMPGE